MRFLLTLIAAELGYIIAILRRRSPQSHRTRSIGVMFTLPNQLSIKGASTMADLVLQIGQSSTGTVVALQADGVTETTGAVLSNVVWALNDPAVTVTANADNTAKITAVSATTSDLSGSVTATVTDSDGTVNSFTANFTVSVGGTTGGNRTASIGVRFSTPQ